MYLCTVNNKTYSMKTKTNDQFIFDANKIHCNRYSYSKTNYKTNKDKVCIICNRHGEF